jgi:hypothetical protein
VNGPINTNTAESYFALLKRGVNGTFHHVSEKHLGRYCDEFSFRWNYRKTNDGERATEAIKGMSGKGYCIRIKCRKLDKFIWLKHTLRCPMDWILKEV